MSSAALTLMLLGIVIALLVVIAVYLSSLSTTLKAMRVAIGMQPHGDSFLQALTGMNSKLDSLNEKIGAIRYRVELAVRTQHEQEMDQEARDVGMRR